MHTLPGRVRRYATTSDVPFRLLPCGDTAAVTATDVRSHWQHLVQVLEDPQGELPEYQPATPPTHGG